MSAVAGLYNVPGTPEELAIWSAIHASHHRDINAAIYRLGGYVLAEFPLDPVPLGNPGGWANSHQEMHNQFQNLLGIAGFDLLDVEWENHNQLAGWIFLNAQVHMQAADILGIG